MSSSTRERIIESGLQILSAAGLAGVSLGGLAEKVGMSKSGLFAHFKSKEHVELELLDQAFSLAIQHVESAALKEPDGLPRLIAAVHAWIGWYTKVGLPGGCPVAAAMFELDDVDGPLRDGMLKNVKLWHKMFKNLFSQRFVKHTYAKTQTRINSFGNYKALILPIIFRLGFSAIRERMNGQKGRLRS